MEFRSKGSQYLLGGVERKARIEGRLKVLRMSKRDLAEHLGVLPPAVTTLLNRDGWRFPSTFVRVAKAIRVDVAYLIWRPAKMDGGLKKE